MLPASALLKRRPRLHLIKLVSAVAALSLVALLYGQHVLRSGAAYNAVGDGGEQKIDIVISQESAAASNAGEREGDTWWVDFNFGLFSRAVGSHSNGPPSKYPYVSQHCPFHDHPNNPELFFP